MSTSPPIRVLGFTGTRAGMTPQQRRAVEILLVAYKKYRGAEFFAHGDCVGADAEAHKLAVRVGLKTAGFPSTLEDQRAHCELDWVDTPRAPLVRNKRIVAKADVMIACPETADEVLRSGTWATIRHAQKTKTPLLLVLPEGRVQVLCLSYWV